MKQTFFKKAVELAERGASISDVARELKASEQTVKGALDKYMSATLGLYAKARIENMLGSLYQKLQEIIQTIDVSQAETLRDKLDAAKSIVKIIERLERASPQDLEKMPVSTIVHIETQRKIAEARRIQEGNVIDAEEDRV